MKDPRIVAELLGSQERKGGRRFMGEVARYEKEKM